MGKDNHLPTGRHNWLERLLQAVSAGLSIAAVFYSEKFIPKNVQEQVYAATIVGLMVVMLGYIVKIHLSKLHRYADVPQYFHYASHTIRDTLAILRTKLKTEKLDQKDYTDILSSTVSILDCISQSFTIITGTTCSVCVKGFRNGTNLRVEFRDSQSKLKRGKLDEESCYDISYDTPCNNIFQGKDGALRHYFCNDVEKAYKEGNYKSPSFAHFGGEPTNIRFFGRKLWGKWCLPYRSCMASPIRFIQGNPATWSMQQRTEAKSTHWNYWGFLCVDSKKRKVFHSDRNSEVLAAFSDLLFIYFSEIWDMIEISVSDSKVNLTGANYSPHNEPNPAHRPKMGNEAVLRGNSTEVNHHVDGAVDVALGLESTKPEAVDSKSSQVGRRRVATKSSTKKNNTRKRAGG